MALKILKFVSNTKIQYSKKFINITGLQHVSISCLLNLTVILARVLNLDTTKLTKHLVLALHK